MLQSPVQSFHARFQNKTTIESAIKYFKTIYPSIPAKRYVMSVVVVMVVVMSFVLSMSMHHRWRFSHTYFNHRKYSVYTNICVRTSRKGESIRGILGRPYRNKLSHKRFRNVRENWAECPHVVHRGIRFSDFKQEQARVDMIAVGFLAYIVLVLDVQFLNLSPRP